MRIGFDLRPAQGPSGGRGIGRYTRSLLDALARAAGAEAEWTLIAWKGHALPELTLPPGTQTQVATVRDSSQPLVRLARRTGKDGPAMLLHRALDRRALAGIARRERLDVLLLTALFERAFFGADGAACPTVKVCYDLAPFHSGEAFGQGRLHGRIYREEVRGLARAEAVLAISEFTRQDVLRLAGADPARVHTIFPGIDSRFGPVAEGEVRAVRARFCPEDDFFLTSGGLSENKNLETAVDALAILRATSPHRARLLALGAPQDTFHPRRAALVARAEGHGLTVGEDIVFLPHVTDAELAALYAASAALVFPSRFEGFGLPPAECMACGSPAIVSDTTSLPEVAGDAGRLVGPEDAAGIAALMARLLDEPDWRRDVIARGLRQAARFGWPQSAAQTLDLLREVAGRPSPVRTPEAATA